MPQETAFHEVSFPFPLALGASGGPVLRTEVVALSSGHEQRNARTGRARRRYDVGHVMRSVADLQKIVEFFEARHGRLHGFRFRDPLDHRSGDAGQSISPFDQVLGIGDGVRDVFQLIKASPGGIAPQRIVTKPVPGNVLVAVDGASVSENVEFAVDHATGLITFLPAHIPQSGMEVTAGFLFDLPVRFDTDELTINLAAFEAGQIPSIPIVELLA
ncbi:MAG: DUF2460 domain-containing protein [Rhizobiaceae bacterium]